MALGPGKYDKLASYVRDQTKAKGGVIVMVFGGEQGDGFAMQAHPRFTTALPQILRRLADEIDQSYADAVDLSKIVNPPGYSREPLDPDATEMFRDSKCPSCGGRVVEGPHGGLSVNYRCEKCKALYCEQGPFGVERIHEPPDKGGKN